MVATPEDASQLIIQAVVYNSVDLLRDLLAANGECVNTVDARGLSAMHIAALEGRLQCLQELLSAGADVNLLSGVAWLCKTPLHMASERGRLEVVQLLVGSGAELLALDLEDHSPLHLAQINAHHEVAQFVMAALQSAQEDRRRLHVKLIEACIQGQLHEVVEVLSHVDRTNAGEVLNGYRIDDRAALHIACLSGGVDVVQTLLGIRGHALIQPSNSDTVLHAAVSSQDLDVTELILNNYPHLVTKANNEGSLPFHWACRCGNLQLVKLLLEFPYPEELWGPIEDVRGNVQFSFPFDVNAADHQCRTGLYLSVANGSSVLVDYLLHFSLEGCPRPIQLDTYSSSGRTPLMLACSSADTSVVKNLLEHGADVNLPVGITDDEVSALDEAVLEEIRCVGSGALNEACERGHTALAHLLLRHGANDQDNRALAIAEKVGNQPLVQLLLLRLVFPDPEYRVNKKCADPLLGSAGQMNVSRSFLPAAVYPTSPCMLNWYNASLQQLLTDWLIAAALQANPRLRTTRMALAALTRLDVSHNRLPTLPAAVFQLPSLRILSASNNRISALELSASSASTCNVPLLEQVALDHNLLVQLPSQLFSLQFPNLQSLDVSYNEIASLPENVWTAPKLRELNVSYNFLKTLPSTTGDCRFPLVAPSSPERERRRTGDSTSLKSEKASVGSGAFETNVTVHELERHNLWQKEVQLARVDDEDAEFGGVEGACSPLVLLNLSGNQLTAVPSGLACCCPRLTRLFLADNKLSCIGPVECLPARLKQLDVSHNFIAQAFEPPQPSQLVCHSRARGAPDGFGGASAVAQRQTRSRSKSAARSQRSLSVARTEHHLHLEACAHKRHNRLEWLRTLNLADNRLRGVPLHVPVAATRGAPRRPRASVDNGNPSRRETLIFPGLTTLDLSGNVLHKVPPEVSELSALSVLNLSGNIGIETLPPEVGLLSKLWSLSLKECGLKEPLRSLIHEHCYKTADLVTYLKSVLEDSKPYSRLKLMIVGVQGIGKTSLLQQLRQEGTVSRKAATSDSWSKRMGHSGGRSDHKGSNMSTVGVDVAEWTYEPKRVKGEASLGPVTFRTWDFGGQREYYATHQYFLSRRSLYVVVWKASDGDAALNDVHQWLVNIQARAPNSTVIIVGTHYDQVVAHLERFPPGYLEDLDAAIRERFVGIADSDKKGLPRVVHSVFVSTKTRHNIRQLCLLLYKSAFELRSAGTKQRLLEQKIPASYLTLEKIIVNLADEFRASGKEPVLKTAQFRDFVQEKMRLLYGRSFRDLVELNQACAFLHDNGIMLHYEDVALRDLYFIDPQWLSDVLAHVITIREINPFARNGIMKTDDLAVLFKAFIRSQSPSAASTNLRAYIVDLLHKFEVALTWQTRFLLIPSLLPDEYQFRAGYPGCEVRPKYPDWEWGSAASVALVPAPKPKLVSVEEKVPGRQLVTLDYRKATTGTSKNVRRAEDQSWASICVEESTLRRLYCMAYVPSGFWSRLITRILDDEKVGTCVKALFRYEEIPEVFRTHPGVFADFRRALNDHTPPEWILWQTGLELRVFGKCLLSVKQFLPLAHVHDVNYSDAELCGRGDDGQWHPVSTEQSALLEFLFPFLRASIDTADGTVVTRTEPRSVARLLAVLVDIVDTLLEDWYPSLGTRFVHTSEGHLLVSRYVVCPECLRRTVAGAPKETTARAVHDDFEILGSPRHDDQCVRSATVNDFCHIAERTPLPRIHIFSVEECMLAVHETAPLECPLHGAFDVVAEAPDVAFADIRDGLLVAPERLKRGKMLGRGAFGFVFKASLKPKEVASAAGTLDVALKMLEPVEPGFGGRASAASAFQMAQQKWARDPLQHCCRAYCTSRQEMNVLSSLQHGHVAALLGVCPRPLALVVELAPMGALTHLLGNYRRSGARLHLAAIQETASQVAKALEYLHDNHIIYRDLKCENVLVWRFPPPFSAVVDVCVKLGDYGISRNSHPSGGAKGFGGTEGFMAPEIMRYNGEQEYTEKVDCFSFAMFLYELITLKLPFDGHDQLKDIILDGGRPSLTPSELLYPCNLLDLMVVCWAQQPADRPSASQLVSMTTAPEFTHLLDVISLSDPDSAVLSSVSFTTVDDADSGFDDGVDGEVWLSRADGSVSILSCNEYGWLDAKCLQTPSEGVVVKAMCVVDETVWMAESSGIVRIFCTSSYLELGAFSVVPFLDSALLSVSIVSMHVFDGADVVVIALPSSLLLCDAKPGCRSVLRRIACSGPTLCSTLLAPSGSRQVWTGHEAGIVGVHSLSAASDALSFSSSLSHSRYHQGEPSAVAHLVSGRSTAFSHCVWSSMSGEARVFLWQESVVTRHLDCRKIFPSSESLSTLDVDVARHGVVTAVELLDLGPGSQLFVGTSTGVVVVAQALDMTPLSAFRPYLEQVRSIVVFDTSALRAQQEATLRARRSTGSAHSSTELMEALFERVSGTLGRLRTPGDEYLAASASYVATIGSGYRCLIDRFMDRKHQKASTVRPTDYGLTAQVWRAHDWI
ncbi:hypothetical protein QR680_009358 [Steinernema hermaphroditum]|uniref:non-specific serine/threonine protein kinase n=1 Tax=Steinernema hermaphroditum TaxID=289476 RepID=A0AA39M8Q3_9BILA|nr:hypothetical protein QR680_009358 [Steinernema hermaphroditum]